MVAGLGKNRQETGKRSKDRQQAGKTESSAAGWSMCGRIEPNQPVFCLNAPGLMPLHHATGTARGLARVARKKLTP
jgi:hypothetical protein